MSADRLLRTEEAARRLDIHRETLYRWVKRGWIEVVRREKARRVLIPESEVRRLLSGRDSTA